MIKCIYWNYIITGTKRRQHWVGQVSFSYHPSLIPPPQWTLPSQKPTSQGDSLSLSMLQQYGLNNPLSNGMVAVAGLRINPAGQHPTFVRALGQSGVEWSQVLHPPHLFQQPLSLSIVLLAPGWDCQLEERHLHLPVPALWQPVSCIQCHNLKGILESWVEHALIVKFPMIVELKNKKGKVRQHKPNFLYKYPIGSQPCLAHILILRLHFKIKHTSQFTAGNKKLKTFYQPVARVSWFNHETSGSLKKCKENLLKQDQRDHAQRLKIDMY